MIEFLIIALTFASVTDDSGFPKGGGWKQFTIAVPDAGVLIIDDPWLIDGTQVLILSGDTLIQHTDFDWQYSAKAIKFHHNSPAAPGDTIIVRWQSASITRELSYHYYKPYKPISPDSASAVSLTQSVGKRQPGSSGLTKGIRREGMISRGIRINPDGSGDVTSGLYLELSGSPARDVQIDAILDDRNLPAASGGGSATLSELERILFRVKSPHLDLQMGDWDLDWKIGRYGVVSRSLKGGNAAVTVPIVRSEVAAAGSNGSFRTVNISGRDGDQGPYELTDRFNTPGIAVVENSERVFLDGRRLTRGRRAGYVIDYSRGTVLFNPTFPIRSDSRIYIEYEYNDEVYPHFLYGARLTKPVQDNSGFSVDLATVIEGRDGERPLAFEWQESWRDALHRAGDNPLGAEVSGIDTVGERLGDYIWSDTLEQQILVFSRPDTVGRPTGHLYVDFSLSPIGDYQRIYDADLQTFYFQWIGSGSGEWSPVRRLPLPDKSTINDVTINYSSEIINLETELALSNHDRNILSPFDDKDNNGAAYRLQGAWKPRGDTPLKITGFARHEDSNFHPLSQTNQVDQMYLWDYHQDTTLFQTELESEVFYGSEQAVSFSGNGGFLNLGEWYKAYRGSIKSTAKVYETSISSRLSLVDGIITTLDQENKRTNLNFNISRKLGRFSPTMDARIENRRVTIDSRLRDGNRYWENSYGIQYEPARERSAYCKLDYRRDFTVASEDFHRQSDSRTYRAGVKERSGHQRGWSVDLLRYHQTYTDPFIQPASSTGAILESFLRPDRSPWQMRLNYALSTGSNRVGVQVSDYVGENRGDYRKEGDRFVPDPEGSYRIREVITDTLHSVTSVNSNIQLNWEPGRIKKLSGDESPLPLGISRSTTYFEAVLTTTTAERWRAIVLYPAAFRENDVISAAWNWQEHLYFLEGNRAGDGKLSLRRDEGRDRAVAGGESYLIENISFRSRHRLTQRLKLQVEPSVDRRRRWGIVHRESRADVISTGGETEVILNTESHRLEYGLGFSYEKRSDRITSGKAFDRAVKPRIEWHISRSTAVVRIDAEWRHLNSSTPSAGYDLTRSFALGDNWTANATIDYQLKTNFSLRAFYRGRWRGSKPPSHIGQIELTVTL